MYFLGRRGFSFLVAWLCVVPAASFAQQAGPGAESEQPSTPPPAAPTAETPDGGMAEHPADPDAAVAQSDAQEPAAAPEPPRGDTPVSLETVLNIDAGAEAAPTEQPDAAVPVPPVPVPPVAAPPKPEPGEPTPPPPPPTPPAVPSGPLILWTTAAWANALGPARCGPNGLEGADLAIKLGSMLRRSTAAAGFGIAAAGALADHPLITWAAREEPDLLAQLIVEAGFSALAVGVSDINGPLLRETQLSEALRQRGIAVIASNLVCGREPYCQSWWTAEDPTPVFETRGRRYAVIAVLPDDLSGRVEPAADRSLELRPAGQTLVERTEQARAAGAELIVASIDHGPDASVNLANFVGPLPPDVRPDLLFSPSAADNLLFLRPLDVHPAIVGTRAGVLMGLRVTKLPDTRDADVFARSVRLGDWDPGFAARVADLGGRYCKARGAPLAGGALDRALSAEELVTLGADAARQLANADLAVVDPLVYDRGFALSKPATLQRGQAERAVVLDSPLVAASVSLDWLGALNKLLVNERPLLLLGPGVDRGDPVIAGRVPVIGAHYRIVTTAVLARSGRLPDGASWTPVDGPSATLRGALLAHLEAAGAGDPRDRLKDPSDRTQWVTRTDIQVQANLTAADNPRPDTYDEPGLQVNDSRQLGARLLLNLDADSPGYLFENALQVAFDRNFETRTTAQDLAFLQTTYTYRGLWPRPFFYPHPFVEGYVETEFEQGDAAYHHLMFRPEAGLRSMVSRVLSLKLSAGFQYEALEPDAKIYPGVGAELLMKPWTIPITTGTLQLEGNVLYYWNSPGLRDQHSLRAQFITSLQLVGPLQFTLTASGVIRKDDGAPVGKGIGLQAGIRVRFVERSMSD